MYVAGVATKRQRLTAKALSSDVGTRAGPFTESSVEAGLLCCEASCASQRPPRPVETWHGACIMYVHYSVGNGNPPFGRSQVAGAKRLWPAGPCAGGAPRPVVARCGPLWPTTGGTAC